MIENKFVIHFLKHLLPNDNINVFLKGAPAAGKTQSPLEVIRFFEKAVVKYVVTTFIPRRKLIIVAEFGAIYTFSIVGDYDNARTEPEDDRPSDPDDGNRDSLSGLSFKASGRIS